MFRNKWNIYLVMIFIIIASILFFTAIAAQADNWIALPPYNVLWPLWSTPLSPVDLVTGLPTPLVSSLTNKTVLPVQPAIIWDPASPEANNGPLPWLAYNTPAVLGGGLLIWDQFYGMRPFPPDYMLDPVTLAPIPIPLPLSYWLLKPIEYGDIWAYELSLGNAVYSTIYGVPPLNLLTPEQIWSFGPLGSPLE